MVLQVRRKCSSRIVDACMEETIMPRTKNANDRALALESIPLTERIKNNLIVVLGTILVSGFTAGMYAAEQFRVSPRDFEIASLKDKVAELRTTAQALAGKSFNVPSCSGVKIDGAWPQRIAANNSFVVKGSAPDMPGARLWLFASLRDGGPPYNPRQPVELLRGNDWEIRETGEKRGNSESKHYRIFVVGEAGEILIREYRRVMNSFMEEVVQEWPKDDRRWPSIKSSLDWPGLVELPRDMVPCDPPLQVVR